MSSNLDLGFPEFNLKMVNPSAREIYEFDDFRLDAGHLMLYQGDAELQLAPKAVETLLALIERHGEIVSKDELLQAVWPDVAVEESNLFLYLSVLRKTLGTQKNGKPWVETLRRRGYRFNGNVQLVHRNRNGGNGIVVEPLHLVSPAPTPSIATTDKGEPGKSGARITRKAFAATGVIAAVAALAFTSWYFFSPRPIDSVAVLPFVNESGDAELDYLSGAMTETAIASLSKVPGLQVKSSASVSRYKGSDIDFQTVGKELNVQALLDARVLQRGEDLTLRVELVDAETGNRLWGETYNKKMSDLWALEREVSRDLADRLKARLLGSSEQEITKHEPPGEAYQLFLRGRSSYRKLTRAEIEKGISFFDQAIEIDPSYALAYAAKAEAYRSLALAADMPSAETLPKARVAAQKAFEINPDLAEAHTGLATVAYLYDWNFAEAEKQFVRALELDPNSAMTQFAYGDFLGRKGEPVESLAHIKRARELDPLSPFLNAFEAFMYPDNDEALRRVNIAIDLAPDFYFARLMAGGIYSRQKMYPESIASLRLAKQLAPEQTWSDVSLARDLMRSGRPDEAREILNEMLRRSETRFVPPYHVASVYRSLGEKDQVFVWLEKAYEEHDPKMVQLTNPQLWKDFSDDPRFKDLTRRMGF